MSHDSCAYTHAGTELASQMSSANRCVTGSMLVCHPCWLFTPVRQVHRAVRYNLTVEICVCCATGGSLRPMPRGGGHGASVACVVARAIIIGPAGRPGRRGACGPGPALKFKLLPPWRIAPAESHLSSNVSLVSGGKARVSGESPREGCCGSHAWVRLVDTGSSRNR